MQIEVEAVAPETVGADVLAVSLADPPTDLSGPAAELDRRMEGRLTRLAAEGELRGDVGTVGIVHVEGALRASRLAVVGIGPRDRVDADAVRTAAAAVARKAGEFATSVGWLLDDTLPLSEADQARAIVEGVVLGSYDPGHWKTDGARPRRLERIVVCSAAQGVERAAKRAGTVAEWTNRARDLVNSPPNETTPERLADQAAEIAAGSAHLEAELLGPDEIQERGMGALAAVAQASHNPPRVIVLRYEPPAAREDVRIGLVGKAITFDTGGISLKPAYRMQDMKGDMAGGGAVIGAMGALAELEVPTRAIAVVGACENMPGGHAYRPGDILTAMNGKTIEVTNTDAEGRLVLADVLWYAREQGATHLLDLATLTGAMELALGDLYAGLFTNDDAWRDEILAAAQTSGDHAWPWPLHPRYRRYVDSHFADMKNASELKQGAPVLAAEFLHEFVGDGPWGHLDMPGPAFLERSRGDYMTQPGGTGWGVRLIVELATRLSND